MLVKASKVIGLPVFTINDGRKIENIEDVIYDPIQNRIEALLTEKGGWFSEARVILFDDLEGIGEDAALITSPNQIKKISEVEKHIEMIAKNDTYLTNTKIITEDGLELGRVSDIYFNSATGRVEEFEVSQGTIRNFKKGKKRVKISDIVTVGQDATIVRITKQQEEMLLREKQKVGAENPPAGSDQSGAGGEYDIKPINASKIQQETKKPIEEVKSKVQEVKDNLKPQITKVELSKKDEVVKGLQTETIETSKTPKIEQKIEQKKPADNTTEVKNKFVERRKRDAVGLYLTKNILRQDDTILAKEGEMVTYKLIQEAEEAEILDQVFNNVAPHLAPMVA